MKKLLGVLLGIVLVFTVSSSTFGYDFGTNITIWDGRGIGSVGNPMEDGETEPGMINNQAWDLEGFFLKDKTLSMVGGFNFKDGVTGYPNYTSGDVFIDIDGDASFGVGANNANFSGYDYVLDLDIAASSYNVYALVSGTHLEDVVDYNRPESSPWKYIDGGENIESGLLGYENLTDLETGFEGGLHYAITGLDLSFLGDDIDNFIAHFTMGCGNDNLMGKTAPVPEPATMMLFGCGLVGMALFGRKKFISHSA